MGTRKNEKKATTTQSGTTDYTGAFKSYDITPEEQELKESAPDRTLADAGTKASFGAARQGIVEGVGGYSGITYKSCQKDRAYYVSNALWWAVPLTWFLAPAISSATERAVGAALFVSGAALLIWTRRVNQFFLPVIRKPRRIVKEGPYRWLKHPGYAGFVLMAEGTFLTLGHWFGVLPLVACIGFLVARARRENRILYARP